MALGRNRIEKHSKFLKFCIKNSKYLIVGKQVLLRSKIGKDFLNNSNNYIPTLDAFLDYRNRILKLRDSKQFPDQWYKNEIEATDLILKYLSESKTL